MAAIDNIRNDTGEVSSLLYVSKSLLRVPEDLKLLDALVDTSRGRNLALSVTGALIFTELHFAQWLEGSRAALDELMISIGRDDRHQNVRIVKNVDSVQRRFGGWSLAYWGTATFVDRLISSVHRGEGSEQARAADIRRLEDIIYQFAMQGAGRTLGR